VKAPILLPIVTILFATLALVFRFLIPLSDRARAKYVLVFDLAVGAYFLIHFDLFWAAIWTYWFYQDLRKPPQTTNPNQLVGIAVVLYGLATVWILDALGLSSLYMRPSVLLTAVLLVVVSLIAWAIIDSRKSIASLENQ
jgi:hypothetical protein